MPVRWPTFLSRAPRRSSRITFLVLAIIVAGLAKSPILIALVSLWVGREVASLGAARRLFRDGPLVAGVVVSVRPPLVASLADLRTGDDHGPYFEVAVAPRDLPKGRDWQTGDRVPCVARLTGSPESYKWDAMEPIPLFVGTENPALLEAAEERLSDADWIMLGEALFRVPRPYRPGHYPVRFDDAPE